MSDDRKPSLGLANLANIISASAQRLDTFVEAQGRSQLSFSSGQSIDDLLTEDPEVQDARHSLLEATTELHDLVLGPAKLVTPSVCLPTLSNRRTET